MNTNNDSFNQLVKYLTEDLNETLSIEQREKIYSLAVAALSIDELRGTSFTDHVNEREAGARMEHYRTGPVEEPDSAFQFFANPWVLALTIVSIAIGTYLYIN